MLSLLLLTLPAADAPEKQRAPRPSEIALVFSAGYAGNHLPAADGDFEKLLLVIKKAGFNTVHTTYSPSRVALCKKHGVKLMVDLLAPEHHVYKSPDKAKKVCEALRDEPAVWGYNIWNDPMGKTAAGRQRDALAVRSWDPTHPVFCGTYRTQGMSRITAPDVIAYYDFHWKRGIAQHLPHLLRYNAWARERNSCFYTWLSATSGLPGKGNYNRGLYSANTFLAAGGKGTIWFLAKDLIDLKTLKWTAGGQDILKVHAEIAPLAKEMAKLGAPADVFSTPITKDVNNRPVPAATKPVMPPGMEGRAFPKDHWLAPRAGEFILGDFGGAKARSVFIANTNAYAPQDVELAVKPGLKAELFARKEGKWKPLEAKAGVVKFPLQPGGGELLRFTE